jgi:hypothetical protein
VRQRTFQVACLYISKRYQVVFCGIFHIRPCVTLCYVIRVTGVMMMSGDIGLLCLA